MNFRVFFTNINSVGMEQAYSGNIDVQAENSIFAEDVAKMMLMERFCKCKDKSVKFFYCDYHYGIWEIHEVVEL